MNQARLNELKKLCDEATPGPWSISYEEVCYTHTDGKKYSLPSARVNRTMKANNNAFIAASRTALPELISEIEYLQKDVIQMETCIDEMCKKHQDNHDEIVRLKKQLEKCKAEFNWIAENFCRKVYKPEEKLEEKNKIMAKLDEELDAIK